MPSDWSVSAAHRFTAAVLTLPLVAVLLLLVPSSAAQAATVYHDTFQGVTVYKEGFADEGCFLRGTFIFGDQRSVRYAEVLYDQCQIPGDYVEIYYVVGFAAPTIFEAKGDLASVHVVATIPLKVYDTGAPFGDVTIDNTWIADGPARRNSYMESFHLPGDHLFIYRFRGTQRHAYVTGTTPGNEAAISRAISMSVDIVN